MRNIAHPTKNVIELVSKFSLSSCNIINILGQFMIPQIQQIEKAANQDFPLGMIIEWSNQVSYLIMQE